MAYRNRYEEENQAWVARHEAAMYEVAGIERQQAEDDAYLDRLAACEALRKPAVHSGEPLEASAPILPRLVTTRLF